MSRIIIKGNVCSIEEETDIPLIRLLDNELSFKVLGAEHTKAFKGYYRNGQFIKWDGIKRILTNDLTFPIGLLDRVKKFYQSYDKTLEVIDYRSKPSIANPINITDNLKKINKVPHDYQLSVIDKIKEKNRGIIRMATGSGKSIVASLMSAYFGKTTIIFVIGKDLLYQMYDLFSKVFNQEIGIVGDGECKIRDINIVSVWTASVALGVNQSEIFVDETDSEKALDATKYRDIFDLLKKVKVCIFDECHAASCESIQEIAKNINKVEHLYGMSASPERGDGSDILIESIFGEKIIDIPASLLIEQGFLVKPIIKFVEVPKLEEKLPKNYQTIYKKYVVDNEIRNQKILEATATLVNNGYKTLVLFSRINHGKELEKLLSQKFSCVLLSGKDSSDKRLEAKKDFESGDIKCIIASTIFDIGVDIPSLSGLVLAGGGKSSVRCLQRIGRVIRLFPGKTHSIIVDFYDNAQYLKNHSNERKRIYESEPGFEINWYK